MAWLLSLGGEEGWEGGKFLKVRTSDDLHHPLVGNWTLWEAGEWNGLLNELGALRLAGGAALSNQVLGDAEHTAVLDHEVPQQSATASSDLEGLSDLKQNIIGHSWLNLGRKKGIYNIFFKLIGTIGGFCLIMLIRRWSDLL